MLLKLFFLALTLGWMRMCYHSDYSEASETDTTLENLAAANPGAPVDFNETILPIMKSNCNPCHFPGGKMYESMPFDQPSTILSHPEGILKRMKGEDAEAIKRFIEENTKASKEVM